MKRKRDVRFVKEQLLERHDRKCYICGITNLRPAVYHFHHIDPTQKKFNISSGIRSRSLKSLYQEANKCIVLCSNCHSGYHDLERVYKEVPINLDTDMVWIRAMIYEFTKDRYRVEEHETTISKKLSPRRRKVIYGQQG